jgi:hypothetical protein
MDRLGGITKVEYVELGTLRYCHIILLNVRWFYWWDTWNFDRRFNNLRTTTTYDKVSVVIKVC